MDFYNTFRQGILEASVLDWVRTLRKGRRGAIVKAVRWHNFPEVRGTFKDADNVRGYVIFNVRQNRYRLITVIHYAKTTAQKRTQGHVYIRSFLTHKEYDNPANWDKELVQNDYRSRRPGQNDRERRATRHSQ
jgi:mRNA interferase HigB